MNFSDCMNRNLIYLALGSNLGDREQHLEDARNIISSKIGRLVRVSKTYESEPWGYSSKNSFYNTCVSLETSLGPLPLLDQILFTEKSLGRVREGGGYSDRQIDIDLLFYGDTILNHPRLIIPHPSLEKRRFVLAPLVEIAPGLVHPINGLSIREMLDQCADSGTVRPL